ncbi:MAG TPA: LysR substrate-binding domain-containing protein [Candidatus Saccharimonadales bacterium]|nr:LysR substrate-binding domain-containing protein [Candidatus Saccharimonadales bacterium]
MELRHLRYFVAVAEELSFTRAAKRLHTAQPSLSQQIRDLEQEIGCPLLERDRQHVSLTAAGKTFLSEARLTLAQAERSSELARQASRSSPNQIRVGLLPGYEAYFLSRVLPVLSTRLPQVSLFVRSLSSRELLSGLQRATIDVALMRPTPGNDRFVSETVREEPLMAVLPSKHRLSRFKTIKLAQLAQERWIIPYPDASGFNVRQTIDAFLDKHEFTPASIQETDNVLANLILVGSGMGVALLPQYVQELRLSTVSCKPLFESAPTIQLLMAYHGESSSEPLKLFLVVVREIMKIQA